MDIRYQIGGAYGLTYHELWIALTANPSDTVFAVGLLLMVLLVFIHIKKAFVGGTLRLSQLTVPSLFISAYLFIVPIPSIIWFCGSTNPIRYTYLLAVDCVPILFLLGVVAANGFFRNPATIISSFLSAKLSKTRMDGYFLPFFRLMFVASILITAVYLVGADYVPLLGSIRQYGSRQGEDVRLSIYSASDMVIYTYALTVRLFLPFCVLYSYLAAQVYKGKWRYRFWIMLGMALFIASLPLERSPTLGLFLILMVGYYFKNNMSISKKHIAILGAAMFVGGMIHRMQYQIEIAAGDVGNYMTDFLMKRIWLDPAYMTFIAFQDFNYSKGFLNGSSIRLFTLFGVTYQSFSSIGFLGDLWANFGWFGVILGTILIGFLLQFVQLTFFKKKSISTLVLYGLLLVNAPWMLYGSVLSTMVISVYFGVVLMMLLYSRGEQKVDEMRSHAARFSAQTDRERVHGLRQPSGLGFPR
jgi:hypothetical protein